MEQKQHYVLVDQKVEELNRKILNFLALEKNDYEREREAMKFFLYENMLLLLEYEDDDLSRNFQRLIIKIGPSVMTEWKEDKELGFNMLHRTSLEGWADRLKMILKIYYIYCKYNLYFFDLNEKKFEKEVEQNDGCDSFDFDYRSSDIDKLDNDNSINELMYIRGKVKGNLCFGGDKTPYNRYCHLINMKDNIGKTPLYYAVKGQSTECVILLLIAGAEIDLKLINEIKGNDNHKIVNIKNILIDLKNKEEKENYPRIDRQVALVRYGLFNQAPNDGSMPLKKIVFEPASPIYLSEEEENPSESNNSPSSSDDEENPPDRNDFDDDAFDKKRIVRDNRFK